MSPPHVIQSRRTIIKLRQLVLANKNQTQVSLLKPTRHGDAHSYTPYFLHVALDSFVNNANGRPHYRRCGSADSLKTSTLSSEPAASFWNLSQGKRGYFVQHSQASCLWNLEFLSKLWYDKTGLSKTHSQPFPFLRTWRATGAVH